MYDTAAKVRMPSAQRMMFSTTCFRSALPRPTWPPIDSMLNDVGVAAWEVEPDTNNDPPITRMAARMMVRCFSMVERRIEKRVVRLKFKALDYLSNCLTAAATRLPSAWPLTLAITADITRPKSFGVGLSSATVAPTAIAISSSLICVGR